MTILSSSIEKGENIMNKLLKQKAEKVIKRDESYFNK